MLARTLDAIAEARSDDTASGFAEHMTFYLKHQKKRDVVDFKLAVDATTLFHLAARNSITLEIPENWRDHLILY